MAVVGAFAHRHVEGHSESGDEVLVLVAVEDEGMCQLYVGARAEGRQAYGPGEPFAAVGRPVDAVEEHYGTFRAVPLDFGMQKPASHPLGVDTAGGRRVFDLAYEARAIGSQHSVGHYGVDDVFDVLIRAGHFRNVDGGVSGPQDYAVLLLTGEKSFPYILLRF